MFRAAYYFNELTTLFSDENKKNAISALIKQLSYFNCKTDKTFDNKEINDSFIMLESLLFKRTSCQLSAFLYENFEKKLSILKSDSELNLFNANEGLKSLIFNSLHIISPEDSKEKQQLILNTDPEFTKSGINEDLIYSILPSFLGNEFLQLIEKEKDFMSLAQNIENTKLVDFTEGKYPEFANYTLDLSLENPITKQGIAIKTAILNPKNESITERDRRIYTEKVIELNNWEKEANITHAHQKNIKEEINKINIFLTKNKEYFKILSENFDSPIYNTEVGSEILFYTLSPFAIARVQSVLLKYLQSNILKITDNEWNIAIIERDIPCAELAISDLENTLRAFLNSQNLNLPKINLTIFSSKIAKKLQKQSNYNIDDIQNKINENIDILIDISILQREGVKSETFTNLAKNTAIIRSIYSLKTSHYELYNHITPFALQTNEIAKFIDFYLKCYENQMDINPYLLDILENNSLFINADNEIKEKIYKSIEKFSAGLVFYFTDSDISNNSNTVNSEIDFNNKNLTDLQKKIYLRNLSEKKYTSCKISYNEAISSSFAEALVLFLKNGGTISAFIFDDANKISEWDSSFSAIYSLMFNNINNFIKENSLSVRIISFSNSISYDSEIILKKLFATTKIVLLKTDSSLIISKEHENLRKLINSRIKEKELKQIENILYNSNPIFIKNKDIILSILKRKFNKKFDFEYYPEIFSSILKIKSNNNEIGNLNYSERDKIKVHIIEETIDNKEIIEFTKEIITKKKTKYSDVFEWLETNKNTDYDLGIEIDSEKKVASQERVITLSFNNSSFEELANLLKNKLLFQINERDFINENIYLTAEKVEQKLQNTIKPDENHLIAEALIKFGEVRNFETTLLAIHRIANTGIINSISINYKNKAIHLKLNDLTEAELHNNLITQIQNLNAGIIPSIKLDEINKIKGNSVLHKILIFYINYLYFELIPLQKQNLLSLNNAERLKNRAENKVAYSNFSHDFFRKKYENPNNVPNLVFDTENFTSSDFKIIYKYINECKHNLDNIMHLKASTESLKEISNNNYIINILYLYSDLIINNNNLESIHQLFDELIVVYDEFGIAFSELLDISKKFLEKLYSRNPNLEAFIEPMKVIKLTNGWLQNFNSKFLQDYEGISNIEEEIEFS